MFPIHGYRKQKFPCQNRGIHYFLTWSANYFFSNESGMFSFMEKFLPILNTPRIQEQEVLFVLKMKTLHFLYSENPGEKNSKTKILHKSKIFGLHCSAEW
jgi:hypothetical protein